MYPTAPVVPFTNLFNSIQSKKKVNGTSQIQCLRTKHNKTQFFNAPICTIKHSALGVEFCRVLNIGILSQVILNDQAFLQMVRN